MPLFRCFNPECSRGFSTNFGLQCIWIKKKIAASLLKIQLCVFLLMNLIWTLPVFPPEVVEEINNNIDNNDNFSIGIDDDDDDDNSESKRQQISELFKESGVNENGSFPISKDYLVNTMTPVSLPPRINFQFSILRLLSHPLIPLYIYSKIICMINEMTNQNENNNSSQFKIIFQQVVNQS